jgi:lysophospholipase L1-like esterase
MYNYLALGDSYTIGELVPTPETFPYQLVSLLRRKNMTIADPVVIAKTGWTTDELMTAIRENPIHEQFTFATLLIGVNNQYRGRSLDNYKEEFTSLLHQAISFAHQNPAQVAVLSIPDWGVTPFAEGKDRTVIAQEIDVFNQAAKAITQQQGCAFLDITDSTRQNGTNPDYLVTDQLHPSGKEYRIWAERLLPVILSMPEFQKYADR